MAPYFVLCYGTWDHSLTGAGIRTQTVLPFFIVTVIRGMREGDLRRDARTVANGSALCVVDPSSIFEYLNRLVPFRVRRLCLYRTDIRVSGIVHPRRRDSLRSV